MKNFSLRAPLACGLALPLVLALSACGGGGDAATTPTPAPTPSALTLTGSAATGAAMAGATVTVTCASGSGTATTASDGSYTISITNGSLPCVLTATSADNSTVLHSVAAGTGTTATTSNITPLSELLVAQLAGTDPATYVAGFTPSTTISTTQVATAQTAVLQTLTAAGVDTTNVTDIVSGTLTAGSGTGYDGVLDQLQTTLVVAGTTLDELTTAVATSSSAGSTTTTSTVSSLLAESNAECSALKSGTHRVINFSAQVSELVTVDATALTVTAGGTTYHLTKTGTAACDYTLDNPEASRVFVAKSGMAVWRDANGGSAEVGISLPEQTLDIASLAGVYNRMTYAGVAIAEGDFGTATFNASGANTSSVNCPTGVGSCVTDSAPQGHLAVNANGGFDYIDDGQGGIVAARVFGFRNAAGKTLLVALEGTGRVTLLNTQGDQPLPAVASSNAFWQFSVNSAGVGVVSEDTVTFSAVDAATSLVTRHFASDGHNDKLKYNDPYAGLRYRVTNDCTSSAGGAFACNGVVQMTLQGSGITLSVSSVSTKHFMTVSVNKP